MLMIWCPLSFSLSVGIAGCPVRSVNPSVHLPGHWSRFPSGPPEDECLAALSISSLLSLVSHVYSMRESMAEELLSLFPCSYLGRRIIEVRAHFFFFFPFLRDINSGRKRPLSLMFFSASSCRKYLSFFFSFPSNEVGWPNINACMRCSFFPWRGPKGQTRALTPSFSPLSRRRAFSLVPVLTLFQPRIFLLLVPFFFSLLSEMPATQSGF